MPKIKRLREIIPLLESGLSCAEVGKHFGVAESTIGLWLKKLRDGGFEVNIKRGRKEIKL